MFEELIKVLSFAVFDAKANKFDNFSYFFFVGQNIERIFDFEKLSHVTKNRRIMIADRNLSFRQNEPNHLMENVIYNEMRQRGWLVDVGNIYHRVRNTEGLQQRVTLEVDFVCNKVSERIYIQSAWRMPDKEKMEQEKRSLRLVGDSFRKILIVGEHTKSWSDKSGIQIMSIYDFLLDKTSTERSS